MRWSTASPQQIRSREKEVGEGAGRKRKKNATLQTRYAVALQGSVGNLIQGHTLTRNQLVLMKEFNSGIIDSDNQIRPWPVEFIFLGPHTVS